MRFALHTGCGVNRFRKLLLFATKLVHTIWAMRAIVLILFLSAIAALGQTGDQWEEVSPEDAEAHLITRGSELVYPAFARAAGIEGTVRIHIAIYFDGRIHSISVESGPPALRQAAIDSVAPATYRPFQKDGHPIGAQTTVALVFKLPPGTHIPPRHPPRLTLDTFRMNYEHPLAPSALSGRFQKWIAAQVKDFVGDMPDDTSAYKPHLSVSRLPLQVVGARLYVVQYNVHELCGATGNCQMDLVEENASGIHPVGLEFSGWSFYARQPVNSQYPEVFFVTNGGGGHQGIAVYSRLAGQWGPLYSGSISVDEDEHEKLTWSTETQPQ